MVPFIGGIILHQFYMRQQELFQLKLAADNQAFQESMQKNMSTWQETMNNQNQEFQTLMQQNNNQFQKEMNNANQVFQNQMQEASFQHADKSPTTQQMLKQGAVQFGSSAAASLFVELIKRKWGNLV